MAILKCKICGGDMEVSPDKSFGVCEYCGTSMTLPKVSDDQRAAMFNRGNHFRRTGEFDKALAIYENIVREDDTDAEAHWCCALCRFGIEYVEDPNSLEYVPTCHRASFDSFLEDVDYLAALEHSDGITRRQYQKDAAKIADVQRGILATSRNEEPFDVFICYKETDDATKERTKDSIDAQEIYYQLTAEGYRVFFSRITLEDKVGAEYEPYIFAALNSAKVMVVIGSKPEYFNAVWVKNEWSRFLVMMRKDRTKLLLPCYKNMDPYDLPESLSVLQSYDMAKIGFIQDLIRGIKKVVRKDEPKAAVKETVVVGAVNANIAPLLERAFLFLEDGKWQDANNYCEKVLDIDPKNAEAYLGKLMAELNVRNRKQLVDCKDPFDDRDNYAKIIRFGDEKLETEMRGYISHINERNENARLEGLFSNAIDFMNKSSTAEQFRIAAGMFRNISGFRNADALADECDEQAEVCRKDAIYNDALSKMRRNIYRGYLDASDAFRKIPGWKEADKLAENCLERAEVCRKDAIYDYAFSLMGQQTVPGYEAAIKSLTSITGWKDADEQITACQRRIEEIKAKEESDRLERERQAEKQRIAAEKARKKAKRIAIIVSCFIIASVLIGLLAKFVFIPNAKYNAAVKLYNQGKYEEAIDAFEALNGYKDSLTQITKCKKSIKDNEYNAALKLYEEGKYVEAIEAFEAMDGYKDSKQRIDEIRDDFVKEKIGDPEIGEYVCFGSYEQDNNVANGKEEIEWLVLAKTDKKIFVISKYALDSLVYNRVKESVTWEECALRQWLNETFLNEAFGKTAQSLIIKETVAADKNPKYEYAASPGNATKDKVFLLSIRQANKYFSSNSERICQGTEYCYARGAYEAENGNCRWWLRSPGASSNSAADVSVSGSVSHIGDSVDYGGGAVRPAMWINLGD